LEHVLLLAHHLLLHLHHFVGFVGFLGFLGFVCSNCWK
jgi:hypothetical protein